MFTIPLYMIVGLALCAFNLLLFYVALRKGNAVWVVAAQGAFAGFVSSLPAVDGFTYIWMFSVSVLFFVIVVVNLLYRVVRARLAKPAAVSS
jgi:hypothetical protein